MMHRFFTGPTIVGEVAKRLRESAAFHAVLEGTEHVYVDSPRERAEVADQIAKILGFRL